MSGNRVHNTHDGQGEVNLRLSAEELSGLGPDVQSLLRQLAASRQEQPQRQSSDSSSHLVIPARSLSEHGRGIIQRPASSETAVGPPTGSSTHHRILPNIWQHQLAVPQQAEMGLDDFGEPQNRVHFEQRQSVTWTCWINKSADRQLLASHEPPQVRVPYVAPDYYMPPVPAATPLSAAGQFPSGPSSSMPSAAFSSAPTLSSSRLTLPSSLANPDNRAAPARKVYSPAMEPRPAAWQFHQTVKGTASPSFARSESLSTSRQSSREKERTKSGESFLVTQKSAHRHHCMWLMYSVNFLSGC